MCGSYLDTDKATLCMFTADLLSIGVSIPRLNFPWRSASARGISTSPKFVSCLDESSVIVPACCLQKSGEALYPKRKKWWNKWVWLKLNLHIFNIFNTSVYHHPFFFLYMHYSHVQSNSPSKPPGAVGIKSQHSSERRSISVLVCVKCKELPWLTPTFATSNNYCILGHPVIPLATWNRCEGTKKNRSIIK